MTKDTKHAWIGYLVVVGAIALLCTTIRVSFADGPPQEVLSNIETIKKNQKILADNREAHDAFEKAKAENEDLEKTNLGLGWRTNWSTMTAVPNEPVPFLPRP